VLGLLWSASGVMGAVRTALNVAWDTGASRPFIRGKVVDLLLVGGIYLVSGATVALAVAAAILRRAARLPAALRELAPLTAVGISAVVIVATTALLFASFVFLYRVVPATPTRLRGIWPGALTAAAGLEALQYAFSAHLSFFGHYNKVYGSLGAVVAFMFFVYLASMVFLFGAEVASEYPRLRGWAPSRSLRGTGRKGPRHPLPHLPGP
jgi:membrane protein